ncbi:DUF4282 domain-containing protein [Salibacterium sp. K-3]
MNNFLNFNTMITPVIIKVIFWIGVVLSIIGGLIQFFIGMTADFGGGGQVFLGLLTIVLGPLFTRIYCELLIIFFKMQESLHQINGKLDTLKESSSHEN